MVRTLRIAYSVHASDLNCAEKSVEWNCEPNHLTLHGTKVCGCGFISFFGGGALIEVRGSVSLMLRVLCSRTVFATTGRSNH